MTSLRYARDAPQTWSPVTCRSSHTPVGVLVARSTRHAETRVVQEPGHQSLEVVLRKSDVGVDHDHHVQVGGDRIDAFVDRTYDRRPAIRLADATYRPCLDPCVPRRERRCGSVRVVRRPVLDDHPLLGPQGLLPQGMVQPSEIVLLVMGRGDNAVIHAETRPVTARGRNVDSQISSIRSESTTYVPLSWVCPRTSDSSALRSTRSWTRAPGSRR